MFDFAVYDGTGRILRWGHVLRKDDVALQQGASETALQPTISVTGGDVQYVNGTVKVQTYDDSGNPGPVEDRANIVARPVDSAYTITPAEPTSIAANGIATAVISGLPNPTKVTVIQTNATSTVVSGSFTFTTSVAGKYSIKCEAFPKQAQFFPVTAT